jgi:hypothetical protein
MFNPLRPMKPCGDCCKFPCWPCRSEAEYQSWLKWVKFVASKKALQEPEPLATEEWKEDLKWQELLQTVNAFHKFARGE